MTTKTIPTPNVHEIAAAQVETGMVMFCERYGEYRRVLDGLARGDSELVVLVWGHDAWETIVLNREARVYVLDIPGSTRG